MKKLIWMVVLLFLFAGCSKPDLTTGTVPSPGESSGSKGYMAQPKILISSIHEYTNEGWADEEKDFQADNISLQGNGIGLNIVFEDDLDENKLKAAVSLENFAGISEIRVFKNEGRTILYANYGGLESNKKYSFVISDKLENKDGKRLETPIRKEITLQPDTIAKYVVVGNEGTYEGVGMRTIMGSYAVGSMNLSSEPKTIIVDFSAEVDTGSVEKSIVEGLKDKNLQYSFEWNGEKRLMIKLDRLKGGEGDAYCISMESAKDRDGNHVYKNFYFTAADANVLGSIDLKNKSNTVLYKFLDKRYMALQNPSISNSIILDDTEAKYVFDMNSKDLKKIDINKEYTLGIPGYRFAYSWKGSDNLLLLNRTTGQIIDYSTSDGSSKELFKLPNEILGRDVMSISVSPNGDKLAVVHVAMPPADSNENMYDKFFIDIFDMNGKLLYNAENLFKARTIEVFGAICNLQWLDNDAVILEDNVSIQDKRDYNVVSINIKTGKKSLIAEHAYQPVTLPGKNLVKVESFKDFGYGSISTDIIRNGKKINILSGNIDQYSNFYFVDENTIIYNTFEYDIFIKHLDTGKSELVGNGYIAGLSQDKSKLYYISNYKMLYYID